MPAIFALAIRLSFRAYASQTGSGLMKNHIDQYIVDDLGSNFDEDNLATHNYALKPSRRRWQHVDQAGREMLFGNSWRQGLAALQVFSDAWRQTAWFPFAFAFFAG